MAECIAVVLLSGDDVRLAVTKFPKIIVVDKAVIKEKKFSLSKFLGFSDPEMKQIFLLDPKIYICGKRVLLERFDYIHNVIGFSHEDIVRWPTILRTRVLILRQRHEFLRFLHRDQFDPTCENYISPRALVCATDVEFCNNVAKVTVKQFNDFLKTR